MNIQSFFFRAGVASLLAVFLAGVSVQAVPPAAHPDVSATEMSDLAALNNQPVAESFRLAYIILGPGKRNYFTHRGTAMNEIQEASKLLGVEIATAKTPKADEDQSRSDARLKLAQLMLEQARARLTAENEKPALEHVDKALTELTKGLMIRAIQDAKD